MIGSFDDHSDDFPEGDSITPRQQRWGGKASPQFRNPLSWSVGIMRLGNVTIRLHALSLAVILIIVFRAIWFSGAEGGILEIGPALILLVALFWVVFASESVVLLTTRALGGSATEIIVQPLGGMDCTIPPSGWKRQVLVSLSGQLFLLAFVVATGVGLAIATDDGLDRLFPNPLMLDRIYEIEMYNSWLLLVLYLFHWVAFLVFAANIIPAPPMRCWNCVLAILRIKYGWQSARVFALRLSIAVVVVLACWAMIEQRFIVLLFAIFLAECIREEYRRIQLVHQALGHDKSHLAASIQIESMVEQEEARASHARRRAKERVQASARNRIEGELDRILEKISSTGLDSLTRAERRILRAATDHRLEDELN